MSDEINAKIDALNDKVDKLMKTVSKLLNTNTKIAKSLHLLPVTEKEERELQLLQRKNLGMAAKINAELNAMENIEDDSATGVFDNLRENVFSDILADDFLGGD